MHLNFFDLPFEIRRMIYTKADRNMRKEVVKPRLEKILTASITHQRVERVHHDYLRISRSVQINSFKMMTIEDYIVSGPDDLERIVSFDTFGYVRTHVFVENEQVVIKLSTRHSQRFYKPQFKTEYTSCLQHFSDVRTDRFFTYELI